MIQKCKISTPTSSKIISEDFKGSTRFYVVIIPGDSSYESSGETEKVNC